MATGVSRRLFAALLCLMGLTAALQAAGPVETSLFAVTGVEVDVTDKDANTARTRAIIEAQTKAFFMLAERMGAPGAAERMKDVKPDTIGRMLKSLSIEEERTGPGRYIGKLTIRFMPAKIRAIFGKYGIETVEDQAPPIIVIPVWNGPNGPELWEDNMWRKAWIDLRAEQATVPVIVPIGDLDDTKLIDAKQAMNMDEGRLNGIRIRYDARAVLVAIAEADPAGGVHAVMRGESPLGTIYFDKTYTADDGSLEGSAALAAQRFHGVMVEKWRGTKQKLAAEARAKREEEQAVQAAAAAEREAAAGPQAISVLVQFGNASEWGNLRNRILATPGVQRVEVASLAGKGAMVRLTFNASMPRLQSALLGNQLRMSQSGGGWVIRAN